VRVWSWLKNPKRVIEPVYHPHFRFDMGEPTRVKLGYIARIRYDFRLLKALNTIDVSSEAPNLCDMNLQEESPFIKIAILENAIEAQLLSSVLTQYEIPHRLRSYHDTAYDGLFQLQKGWGEIYGPDNVRQQVLDALVELRSQAADIHDNEPES